MSQGVWGERAWVLAVAVVLDLARGELPSRWHPVAWMGWLVSSLEIGAPRQVPSKQLAYGAVAEGVCLAAIALPALLWERLLGRLPWPVRTVAMAAILKPTFSIRELFASVQRVGQALDAGDLACARCRVSQIVSRDVTELDESRVAAAAVESLAENASDSVVAPFLAYATFGLPGAYAYRMANTLDAMWGYRGKYEYLGKVAARLDDILNVVPSRLTALASVVGCTVAGGAPGLALRRALRDSSRTASPNAGWPMAAIAGGLDVRLEKVGHYVLNPGGRAPRSADIHRAVRLVAAGLGVAGLGIILVLGGCRRGNRG